MGISSRAKKWLGRLRGRSSCSQEEEAQQLRPVALAGASRKSGGRSSTPCSLFAATVSTEELQRSFRRCRSSSNSSSPVAGATSAPTNAPPAGWTQCRTCARNFLAPASSYKDFCSIDCKSLSLYRTSSFS